MKDQDKLYIFGEVLFDCFPSGEQVLGGAPFNVAYHLHALGDQPLFISKIGADAKGDKILQQMRAAGIETAGVQRDDQHPTGVVQVSLQDGDPSYEIVEGVAYDFITAETLPVTASKGILYHGTLGLRNGVSREALDKIKDNTRLKIFLDVNLRPPWFAKDEVLQWMRDAHWVKMNVAELDLLSDSEGDTLQQMDQLQTECAVDELIVTRGEEGALVRTASGTLYSYPPPDSVQIVDTVGAGDAFSAVYIHGLKAGWRVEDSLKHAQNFAAKVIGLRGATTRDVSFYQEFISSLGTS